LSLPIFETTRLRLRQRSAADEEACFAMDREPGMLRYIAGPWADTAAHRAFIAARTRGPYPAGLGYWSILDKTSGEAFLGWVLLIPVDARGPEVEIGWRLRGAAQGRGIATEAAGIVLRHGLETLGLAAIVAEIDGRNAASLRVAEKLGMRRAGEVGGATGPAVRYIAGGGQRG
jgi:RimJ/RimL family protein N-acetyltransferase